MHFQTLNRIKINYPFGSVIATRAFASKEYRYGFGGHEKDDEVKGSGNHYSFADYGYEPRLGRRWNVDPLSVAAPGWTPYRTFYNNSIYWTDPTGLLEWKPNSDGNLIAEDGDNALTLSEYLEISYNEANKLFTNLENWDGGNNTTGISGVTGHTLTIKDEGLRIGNLAEYHLGSTDWNYEVAKGDYPAKSNKCNIFCYDMTSSAGASPGTPNVINPGWSRLPFVSEKYGPPFAGQWADPNYFIPGWEVLGADQIPRRGDVAAYQFPYSDASGHVAIVAKYGFTIGTSGTYQSIAKTKFGFDPVLSNGQPIIFRRYTGK